MKARTRPSSLLEPGVGVRGTRKQSRRGLHHPWRTWTGLRTLYFVLCMVDWTASASAKPSFHTENCVGLHCLLALSGSDLRVAALVCREWYWTATRILWSTKGIPLSVLLERIPFLAEESESAMVSPSRMLRMERRVERTPS